MSEPGSERESTTSKTLRVALFVAGLAAFWEFLGAVMSSHTDPTNRLVNAVAGGSAAVVAAVCLAGFAAVTARRPGA